MPIGHVALHTAKKEVKQMRDPETKNKPEVERYGREG
jgi:hypothetical protein